MCGEGSFYSICQSYRLRLPVEAKRLKTSKEATKELLNWFTELIYSQKTKESCLNLRNTLSPPPHTGSKSSFPRIKSLSVWTQSVPAQVQLMWVKEVRREDAHWRWHVQRVDPPRWHRQGEVQPVHIVHVGAVQSGGGRVFVQVPFHGNRGGVDLLGQLQRLRVSTQEGFQLVGGGQRPRAGRGLELRRRRPGHLDQGRRAGRGGVDGEDGDAGRHGERLVQTGRMLSGEGWNLWNTNVSECENPLRLIFYRPMSPTKKKLQYFSPPLSINTSNKSSICWLAAVGRWGKDRKTGQCLSLKNTLYLRACFLVTWTVACKPRVCLTASS